jgi:tetratricopeptide (TPR) repeat protein
LIGRTISQYRIFDKLGEGGMGVVYKAEDLRLGRHVAMKFLPSGVGRDSAAGRRFLQEARAISTLDHPNICAVHEIDESPDGRLFIVMPCYEGKALGDLIREGPLPIAKVLDVAVQVARGLAQAHAKGVVHRDIKPANIVITDDGLVKIVDFGIAKLAGHTRLTKTGTAVGTTAYMSPEQITGGEEDHRTDLWSVGVVMYEMLTGETPFAAKYEPAIAYLVVNKDPLPATSLRSGVPSALNEIIVKALEKERDRRYQSASQLCSDLEKLAGSGGAIPVGRESVPGSPAENDVAAARQAFERQSWVDAFRLFHEADEAGGLSAGDLEQFADAAFWVGREDICVDARERAYAEHIRSNDGPRAAHAATQLAEDYRNKGAEAVAQGWLKRAESLLKDHTDSLEYGYLLRFRARLLVESASNLDEGLGLSKRAQQIAERLGDRNLYALAIQDRGRILIFQGDVSGGMALVDEAMAAAVGGELIPQVVGRTYCNMISTCQKLADFRRAGEWSDLAIKWCEPHSRSAYPGLCSVHRAEVMMARGDWREAERQAQIACDDHRGFITPIAGEAFYEMGEIKLRMGDLAAAEDEFRRAHELGREPLPGLALLRLAEGKTGAARKLIDRGLAEESTLEVNRLRLLPAKVEIAIAAADLDGARTAVSEIERLAGRYDSSFFHGSAAYCSGALSLAKNRTDDSVVFFRRALKEWKDNDLPYEAAKTRLMLAKAYLKAGDPDAAGLEANTARIAFDRLGAAADVAAVRKLLEEMPT